MKWRRWLLALHRDMGYFFTGVVVLYAVSGIAGNHTDDWNSDFIINRRDIEIDLPNEPARITSEHVVSSLERLGEAANYRTFDFPSSDKIKIYLADGSIMASLSDGRGIQESIRRRPLFYDANRLHRNPTEFWKVFSDLFAVALILLALSGLIITRGPQGLLGRGKWLVGAGLLAPLVAMLLL
jgi:hypothetical protein